MQKLIDFSLGVDFQDPVHMTDKIVSIFCPSTWSKGAYY